LVERARGDASAFAAYVAFLPPRYDDPFHWRPAQRALLAGTRLGRAADRYESHLAALAGWAAELRAICVASGAPAAAARLEGWPLSLAAARWARSAVWSRAFTVRRAAALLGACGAGAGGGGDGSADPAAAGPVTALLPLIDMLDHAPGADVAWHTGPEGADHLAFVTRTALRGGTALVSNYGSHKSNEELILAYGFALPDNPNDAFHVALSPGGGGGEDGGEGGGGGDGDAPAARRRALATLSLPTEHLLTAAAPLPPALLAAAACCLAQEGQLRALLQPAAEEEEEEGGSETAAASASGRGEGRAGDAGGVWRALSPLHRLSALVALRQQLAARLAAMWDPAAGDGPASAAAGATDGGGGDSDGEVDPGAAAERHARLAHMYIASQRRIVAAAAAAIADAVGAELSALSAAAPPLAAAAGGAEAAGGSDPDARAALAALPLAAGARLQPPAVAGAGWSLVVADAALPAGAVLSDAPAEACFFGDSPAALAQELAVAASSSGGGARRALASALLASAPLSAAAAQLTGAAEYMRYLDNSPAGDALSDEAEALHTELSAALPALSAALSAAAGGPPSAAAARPSLPRLLLAARAAVDGGAVALGGPPGGRRWGLHPLAALLPLPLREAALAIEPAPGGGLRALAAAALAPGTRLAADVAWRAAGGDEEARLLAGGPAAAAVLLAGFGGAEEPPPAPSSLSYDLAIAPAEGAADGAARRRLLAAAGLGAAHHLRPGCDGAAELRRLLAATVVCLCDDGAVLAAGPAARRCLALAEREAEGDAEDLPAAPVVLGGEAAGAGSGAGAAARRELAAAQRAFLGEAAAADPRLARAALKQLRDALASALRDAQRGAARCDKALAAAGGGGAPVAAACRRYLRALEAAVAPVAAAVKAALGGGGGSSGRKRGREHG